MSTFADIGPQLVRARTARGVTQRELGAALGVAQPQVARWEANGYRTVALERVSAVAEALGIEAAEFDTLVAEESPSAYAPTVVRPVHDLAEIVTRIRAHGDELRRNFAMARIGVFGSFVTGTQTPGSDVDLLVEFADLSWANLVDGATACEQFLGRGVDLVRANALREELRDRVLREALYVWEA